MSVRALGIALKLTFSGVNQLVYLQTWVFAVIVAACVVTQINYLNKVTFLSLNFFGHCDCMIIIFVSLFFSRHLTPSTQQLYHLYTMLCSHHLPFWQVLLCSRYNPFLLLLILFQYLSYQHHHHHRFIIILFLFLSSGYNLCSLF